MPAIGIKCPVKEENIPFAECLGCAATWTQKCHFTLPVLQQMVASMLDERDPVSVTETGGCIRQSWLKRKADYFVDPAEEYWRFRGQLTHTILERYDDKGILKEARLRRVFIYEGEEFPLLGRPDLVIIPIELLVDYKTCTAVPRYDNPYKNHTLQTNQYRWILAAPEMWTPGDGPSSGLPDEWQAHAPIPISTIEIDYMDMDQPKRLDAQVWPPEKVERHLVQKLVPLWRAIREDKCPPVPKNKEDGLWACGRYCNVALMDKCEAIKFRNLKRRLRDEIMKKAGVPASMFGNGDLENGSGDGI